MMNNNSMEIESNIRNFVADNFLFSEGVFEYEDDTSFLREGIIDSLGVMELVSFVETQYRIPVVPVDVTPDNFDSVTKLASYVRSKLTAQVITTPSDQMQKDFA